MKLIDADKLYNVFDEYGDFTEFFVRQILNIIGNQEEVEAIPVEWLINHIPHDEVMERYNEKLIEYLVIGWRKENE